MPKRKSRKSLSQPSTSTNISNSQNLTEAHSSTQISSEDYISKQEHDHHVGNVVKYILAADSAKTPIIRSSISKAINCHGKTFRAVFNSAQEVLKDVFGYKLVDLENGRFILCNMLKNEHLRFDQDTQNYHVLLFLTLAHIYMSGEMCTEASLFDFLIKLEIISMDNYTNPIFGNVIEIITKKFVKDKYIIIEKTENDENGEAEYKWGVRAHEELSVRSVMEFVSKVYGGRDMESWPQQYKDMIDKEKKMGQNAGQNVEQNVEQNIELIEEPSTADEENEEEERRGGGEEEEEMEEEEEEEGEEEDL